MRLSDRSFFTYYLYKDSESRKTLKSLLSVILFTAVTVLILLLFLRLYESFNPSFTDLVITLQVVLYAGYSFIVRRDKLILASFLFLATAWISLTVTASISSGIKDVSVFGYILIIFLSGLLTGYRFTIILTLFTIASVWIMAFAEQKGILVPYKDRPVDYARDLTIVIALVLAAIIFFERSFKYSFSRLNRELIEKKEAEKLLLENETVLKEKNSELHKARMKAEESEKMKTAFIQNITHEIRTPMNGIVGFAELMKDRSLPEDRRQEYLNYITECARQLTDVITDLIDVSKIEAGDIALNIRIFTADEIVKSLSTDCLESAGQKGIDFICCDNSRGALIKSDPEKISRVVNNILCNAVKFTHKGYVKISFDRVMSDLIITVEDTGIGISREEIGLIFNRFRQADSSLTRRFSGSGLGLSISKGIVDFMGGRISVDSTPGKGSVFTLILPVEFAAS